MKAAELKQILRMRGIEWKGVMICLILKALNQAGMSVEKAEEFFGSIRYMKLSAIKVLRMIREMRKKTVSKEVNSCKVCLGEHKIRVFNFMAEFPKNFDLKSLLTVPLRNYSVEIECPRCGDKGTWERYNQKLKQRSELEQEIAKVYLLRYQEQLT